MVWRDLFPTLKRGANIHCAYGALTGAIGNSADRLLISYKAAAPPFPLLDSIFGGTNNA